jgi:hypothetical protein
MAFSTREFSESFEGNPILSVRVGRGKPKSRALLSGLGQWLFPEK